jgi:hypothetical protein
MTRARTTLALALLLLPPALASAVPNTIGFSARIADAGRPVTGSQSFTFSLWTVESAGDPAVDKIWEETKSLTASDGVVTTALGDVDPVGNPLPVLSGAPIWLEVTMGTQTFSPRIAFHSAPFALRAGAADTAASVDWANVTNRPALDCVNVTNGPVSVAVNAATSALASCAAGYVVTGGGFNETALLNGFVIWQTSQSGNGWLLRGINQGISAASVTVFARCCRIP